MEKGEGVQGACCGGDVYPSRDDTRRTPLFSYFSNFLRAFCMFSNIVADAEITHNTYIIYITNNILTGPRDLGHIVAGI